MRVYIGHPVVWKPISAGHVWYGEEKGYLRPVVGGYVKNCAGKCVPAIRE